MSSRRLSRRRVLLALSAALPVGFVGCGRKTPVAASGLIAGVFEPPRQAPDFTLQGTDGGELTLSSYRGKVVLLAFGYSTCPSVCPTTLATFARARRQLGAEAQGIQIVYITVDPERDVPGRLKGFVTGFDPTFVGGTGTETELAAVRESYGATAKKIPLGPTYAFTHSSSTYLIDRSGLIRGLMPYGHSADDYVHDLRILLRG